MFFCTSIFITVMQPSIFIPLQKQMSNNIFYLNHTNLNVVQQTQSQCRNT